MLSRWMGASWDTIAFVALGAAAIYVVTVIGVRIAGRRTLSQMSAFDGVITVALGTIVGNTALSREPSFTQGVTALATLLALQMLVGFARRHSSRFRLLVDFEPVRVASDGEMDESAASHVTSAQMTRADLMTKLRQHGVFDIEDVEVAILEPDGSLSVRVRPGAPAR